jgi:hypothetical protein
LVNQVAVVYNGGIELGVVGCRSGNRYIFLPGRTRTIDKNDAICLVELKDFSYDMASNQSEDSEHGEFGIGF